LPGHAVETLPELRFPSVGEASLADIWYHSAAFERFRGTGWMPEPCRSCERRKIDWGAGAVRPLRWPMLPAPIPLARCPPTTRCSPGRTARLNKPRPISSTARIPPRRRDWPNQCDSRLAGSEPGSAHHRHWRLASAWARRSSSMTALIWGGSRNRPTRPPTPPPACRPSAVSACS